MKLHNVTHGLALVALIGAAAGCGAEGGSPAAERLDSQAEATMPAMTAIGVVGEPGTTPAAVDTPAVGHLLANYFQLVGGGLYVVYDRLDEAGLPYLFYQNGDQGRTFRGNEIHTVPTDAGTLVSVYVNQTDRASSTSFSLLIPRTEVEPDGAPTTLDGYPDPTWTTVVTQGITTYHQLSDVPLSSWGQIDRYSFTPLQGIASWKTVVVPPTTSGTPLATAMR